MRVGPAEALPPLRRTVSVFAHSADALVASLPLRDPPLAALQRIFGVAATDPMFDEFPIGPAQAQALRPYLDYPYDFTRFAYFLSCDADT